jgi:hypothetical protein
MDQEEVLDKIEEADAQGDHAARVNYIDLALTSASPPLEPEQRRAVRLLRAASLLQLARFVDCRNQIDELRAECNRVGDRETLEDLQVIEEQLQHVLGEGSLNVRIVDPLEHLILVRDKLCGAVALPIGEVQRLCLGVFPELGMIGAYSLMLKVVGFLRRFTQQLPPRDAAYVLTVQAVVLLVFKRKGSPFRDETTAQEASVVQAIEDRLAILFPGFGDGEDIGRFTSDGCAKRALQAAEEAHAIMHGTARSIPWEYRQATYTSTALWPIVHSVLSSCCIENKAIREALCAVDCGRAHALRNRWRNAEQFELKPSVTDFARSCRQIFAATQADSIIVYNYAPQLPGAPGFRGVDSRYAISVWIVFYKQPEKRSDLHVIHQLVLEVDDPEVAGSDSALGNLVVWLDRYFEGCFELARNPKPKATQKPTDTIARDQLDGMLASLSRSLFEPYLQWLPGKTLVIPPTTLMRVPFPVISPQLQNRAIWLMPSLAAAQHLATLKNSRSSREQGNDALVVGTNHGGLFWAENEATEAARHYSSLGNCKALTLVGSQVEKAAILAALRKGDVRFLHFCLHNRRTSVTSPSDSRADVVGDDEVPVEGELILSGSEALSARELQQLDLRSVDLCVVNCCYTAGEKKSSDGLAGYARALLAAGVANVLVSLWPVADKQGSSLVLEFLRHALGQERVHHLAQALQLAIEQTRRAHPDQPWLWGGFQLYGLGRL